MSTPKAPEQVYEIQRMNVNMWLDKCIRAVLETLIAAIILLCLFFQYILKIMWRVKIYPLWTIFEAEDKNF